MSVLVTTTVALGTAAPEASVTVPVMLPRPEVCAKAAVTEKRQQAARGRSCLNEMDMLQRAPCRWPVRTDERVQTEGEQGPFPIEAGSTANAVKAAQKMGSFDLL